MNTQAISSNIIDRLRLGLSRIVKWREIRLTRRTNRDAFLNFAVKTPSLIRDVGFEPADVQWAAKLPLAVDAWQALRERTALRDQQPAARLSAQNNRALPLPSCIDVTSRLIGKPDCQNHATAATPSRQHEPQQTPDTDCVEYSNRSSSAARLCGVQLHGS